MSDDQGFTTVARADDVGPGELRYVELDGDPVCLINADGEFFAIGDTCTHEGASLSDGVLLGDILECPLHGGSYEIRTGAPAGRPVTEAALTYRVRIVDGDVQLARA